MVQQTVKLNYLHMAPRKVRLIANTLKGLPLEEAEAQLVLRPQRAAKPLLKLLRSAAANIRTNKKMNPEQFVVSSIRVDQGSMLKRFLPRAMGRATPIQKKMSHVTLVLEENTKARVPRFTILPPPKKEKKHKGHKAAKTTKTSEIQVEKPKEKAGIFKRFFRRKTV